MPFREWFRRRKAPLLHVAEDRGEGPVVVLVHGLASSHVDFHYLIPLLEKKYHVLAVDILGFGDSEAPAGTKFTLDDHANALAATIDSLRPPSPFVLVGHSLGSLIAARYAAANPRKVSQLVMVSPPIYLPPAAVGDPLEKAVMGAYFKAYEFLRRNKNFTMRNAMLISRFLPIEHVLEVTEENWNAFVLSLQNAVEAQTTISDIASVDAPIDLVYGSLDPFVTPAGLRIADRMRHVTTHRVDGNDHLVRKKLARSIEAVITPAAASTSLK